MLLMPQVAFMFITQTGVYAPPIPYENKTARHHLIQIPQRAVH
jgi:hypothetical protein